MKSLDASQLPTTPALRARLGTATPPPSRRRQSRYDRAADFKNRPQPSPKTRRAARNKLTLAGILYSGGYRLTQEPAQPGRVRGKRPAASAALCWCGKTQGHRGWCDVKPA